MWMPGIPHDPADTHGGLVSVAAVCHRTYGGWGGDYAVGQGSRGSIGFHFLVGPNDGQWVQFASTDERCYHAKGANDWSVGIEVSGTNEDPFTPWQVLACAEIVGWLHDTHGIPLDYYDSGRAGRRAGFVAHNAIAGSDHTDRWGANWDRVVAQIGVDMTPEEHGQLWETWQRAKNLESWAGALEKLVHTLIAKVDSVKAGGGTVDVDALAEAVADKLAERLED